MVNTLRRRKDKDPVPADTSYAPLPLPAGVIPAPGGRSLPLPAGVIPAPGSRSQPLPPPPKVSWTHALTCLGLGVPLVEPLANSQWNCRAPNTNHQKSHTSNFSNIQVLGTILKIEFSLIQPRVWFQKCYTAKAPQTIMLGLGHHQLTEKESQKAQLEIKWITNLLWPSSDDTHRTSCYTIHVCFVR